MALTRLKSDQIADGQITGSDLATNIVVSTTGNITTEGRLGVGTDTPLGNIHSKSTINSLIVLESEDNNSDIIFMDTVGSTRIRSAGASLQFWTGGDASTIATNASVALTLTDDVTVANNLVIGGNLTVNGTTTTLNTATLDVEDINITIAKGALDSATANGAGITVDGAGATLTYVHSGTKWAFNKSLDVTGTVIADGLTVDGTLGSFAVDAQGVIASFSRPTTSYIRATNAAGQLRIDTGGSVARALFAANGDISFYEDTGTTAKFFWDASAESLGIGTSTPNHTLDVKSSGTNSQDMFQLSSASGVRARISTDAQDDGYMYLYNSADALKVSFRTDANHSFINGGGNLGIGTDSPENKLTIVKNTTAATENSYGIAIQSVNTNAYTELLLGASDAVDAGIIQTAAKNTNFTAKNLALQPQGGNVGIGTSSPAAKLHIGGNTASTQQAIFTTGVSDSDFKVVARNGVSGATAIQGYIGLDYANGVWPLLAGVQFIRNSTSGELAFTAGTTTSASEQMRLTSTGLDVKGKLGVGYSDFAGLPTNGAAFAGSVGIGTDSPTHLLDVDGAIATRQVRHSIRPTLNLDFANSKELDSRITFYRDSIATYYDSKGVLKYANVNEPRFDHDPATGESKGLLIEEARTNLAANSAKFTTLSTTLCSITSVVAPDGTFTGVKIREQESATAVTRSVHTGSYAITPGTTYTVSAYIKANERSKLQFRVETGGVWSYHILNVNLATDTATSSTYQQTNSNWTITDVGNGWKRVSASIVPVASSTSLYLVIMPVDVTNAYIGVNGYGLSFWGVQIEVGAFATSYIPPDTSFTSRSSTATYHDETGILRTAPVNGARYGYSSPYIHQYFHNTNGLPKMQYEILPERKQIETGLILENAATNLEDYGILADSSNHGTYLTTGASFAVTTETTAPDGSYTASKMTFVGSNDRIDDNHNTFSNGQIYTYSVWLKGPANTAVNVAILTNTGANVEPTIRLTGEWQKVSVTKTFLATDGGTLVRTHGAIIRGAPGSAAFVTNGGGQVTWASYVYVWGMQVELGAVPTSTIPTYGGTATRAADVASSVAYTRQAEQAVISGNNFSDWYNTDYGTLFSESKAMKTNYWSSAVLLTNDEVAGSSGTGRDFIEHVYYTSNTALAQAEVITDGVGVNDGWMAVDRAQYAKIANAFAEDNFASSVNGSVATTDTSGLVPRKINAMYIGAFYVNYDPFCGHIKKISYYPERLTNAELQALTENN